MIPQTVLTYWRSNHAPWSGDDQVEQDLVISRALVDLYSNKLIAIGFLVRLRSNRFPWKNYSEPSLEHFINARKVAIYLTCGYAKTC